MASITTSLIIPTFNRASMLHQALDAIAASEFDFDRLEVTVVDDGSDDETGCIRSRHFPFSLKYLYQDNCGDAVARNRGTQVSCGDFLIFVDDDVLVSPSSLKNLQRDHPAREGVILLGNLVHTSPSEAERAAPGDGVSAAQSASSVRFTECNSGLMAMRREDFFRIGMWQPLPVKGSSVWCDVDFAYRAHIAGFTFIKLADAVGIHVDDHLSSIETKSRRMFRAARDGVLLFQRHPGLQELLPMFTDKSGVRWGMDPFELTVRKVLRPVTSSSVVMTLLLVLLKLASRSIRNPGPANAVERWVIGGYIYRGYRQGLKDFGPIPAEG